jgi:hypothetical protein
MVSAAAKRTSAKEELREVTNSIRGEMSAELGQGRPFFRRHRQILRRFCFQAGGDMRKSKA